MSEPQKPASTPLQPKPPSSDRLQAQIARLEKSLDPSSAVNRSEDYTVLNDQGEIAKKVKVVDQGGKKVVFEINGETETPIKNPVIQNRQTEEAKALAKAKRAGEALLNDASDSVRRQILDQAAVTPDGKLGFQGENLKNIADELNKQQIPYRDINGKVLLVELPPREADVLADQIANAKAAAAKAPAAEAAAKAAAADLESAVQQFAKSDALKDARIALDEGDRFIEISGKGEGAKKLLEALEAKEIDFVRAGDKILIPADSHTALAGLADQLENGLAPGPAAAEAAPKPTELPKPQGPRSQKPELNNVGANGYDGVSRRPLRNQSPNPLADVSAPGGMQPTGPEQTPLQRRRFEIERAAPETVSAPAAPAAPAAATETVPAPAAPAAVKPTPELPTMAPEAELLAREAAQTGNALKQTLREGLASAAKIADEAAGPAMIVEAAVRAGAGAVERSANAQSSGLVADTAAAGRAGAAKGVAEMGAGLVGSAFELSRNVPILGVGNIPGMVLSNIPQVPPLNAGGLTDAVLGKGTTEKAAKIISDSPEWLAQALDPVAVQRGKQGERENANTAKAKARFKQRGMDKIEEVPPVERMVMLEKEMKLVNRELNIAELEKQNLSWYESKSAVNENITGLMMVREGLQVLQNNAVVDRNEQIQRAQKVAASLPDSKVAGVEPTKEQTNGRGAPKEGPSSTPTNATGMRDKGGQGASLS